jgi:uncharacterized membrane protein YeiH
MQSLLFIFEVAAVLASGLSGGLDARRKSMDFVGVYFVALVTALGGGTVRDTVLGRLPVFWTTDSSYALYVLCAALLVVVLYKRSVLEKPRIQKLIVLCDAIGLGLFSVVGTSFALDAGCPLFPAVLIGVLNGIMGGVIRDVICNEIPAVFTPVTQLYATCSFAGCALYGTLLQLSVEPRTAFVSGALAAFLIRIIAIRFKIGLPV